MCDICDALNSERVITTDDTIAILSADSSAPAVLVAAKQHAGLAELPKSVQQHLFATANNLSSLVFDIMQVQGTNVIADDSEHASMLVVGRLDQDTLDLRWKPVRATPEDLEGTAKRIQEETWYIGKEEQKPAPSVVTEDRLPATAHEPKTGEAPKDVAADIQKKVEEGPKTEHNYMIKHLWRRR